MCEGLGRGGGGRGHHHYQADRGSTRRGTWTHSIINEHGFPLQRAIQQNQRFLLCFKRYFPYNWDLSLGSDATNFQNSIADPQ